jgi:hypothetical protein
MITEIVVRIWLWVWPWEWTKELGGGKDFGGKDVRQLRGHKFNGSNMWILNSQSPRMEIRLREERTTVSWIVNPPMNLADALDNFHLLPSSITFLYLAQRGTHKQAPLPSGLHWMKRRRVALEYLFPLLHCCRIDVNQAHLFTERHNSCWQHPQPSWSPSPPPSPSSIILRFITKELYCY